MAQKRKIFDVLLSSQVSVDDYRFVVNIVVFHLRMDGRNEAIRSCKEWSF